MIKTLDIIKYRKISNVKFDFKPSMNLISGTNGTCKTSIMHLISNSFQAEKVRNPQLTDSKCMPIINAINSRTNPKVETLTMGDKQYNDPARGLSGTLFKVEYFNGINLEFRRHNSTINGRYAIKPIYRKGAGETLPSCPVIYLGLTRLVPIGELNDTITNVNINKKLPVEYQNEIALLYKRLAAMEIEFTENNKVGNLKTRSVFNSKVVGIDSNTISAGEDNLYIILTALVSLKYYYKCKQPNARKTIESILLIDEIDATLHPALQFNLYDIIKQYSEENKIQVFFTTHSLTLIEHAIKRKCGITYLVNNLTNAVKMENPDIYKIRMHLSSLSADSIYFDRFIAVLMEDDEARVFKDIIFDYFCRKSDEFSKVSRFFYFPQSKIGSDNLRTLFIDDKLRTSVLKMFCILDGDQSPDLSKGYIALPGNDSPENLVMKYSKKLYEEDSPFWTTTAIIDNNYGKQFFHDSILPEIDAIEDKIQTLTAQGNSIKGIRREMSKNCFIKNIVFFKLVFIEWVNNIENSEAINFFYSNLQKMFKKVADINGINPNEWSKPLD